MPLCLLGSTWFSGFSIRWLYQVLFQSPLGCGSKWAGSMQKPLWPQQIACHRLSSLWGHSLSYESDSITKIKTTIFETLQHCEGWAKTDFMVLKPDKKPQAEQQVYHCHWVVYVSHTNDVTDFRTHCYNNPMYTGVLLDCNRKRPNHSRAELSSVDTISISPVQGVLCSTYHSWHGLQPPYNPEVDAVNGAFSFLAISFPRIKKECSVGSISTSSASKILA